MNSITKLTQTQTEQAVVAMSFAFSQDPIINYFLPEDPAANLKARRQICQGLIRYTQPYDHIYTTSGELKGVAAWLPPKASSNLLLEVWHFVTSGLLIVPFSMRWERFLDFLNFFIQEGATRQHYVSEPHWYLMLLGVVPESQGQGIGGQLIQPILQEADQNQTLCYLETSTESGVRFYSRHGFEVIEQKTLTEGVHFWTMKRQPQTLEV
jgi:ribosomal protein S18 acetylase RimI-like enzyme